MFFKRRQAEPEGPQFGPGGGKVRSRPRRQLLKKRQSGVADVVLLALLLGLVVVVVEHFVLGAGWAFSIIVTVPAMIMAATWTFLRERRRRRPSAPVAQPKHRREPWGKRYR